MLKNERLKKLRATLNKKPVYEYHNKGIATDTEKLSKTSKKSKRNKADRKFTLGSQ